MPFERWDCTVCAGIENSGKCLLSLLVFFIHIPKKLSSASLWIWPKEELDRSLISNLESQCLFGIYSPLKLPPAWDCDEKRMSKRRCTSWSLLPSTCTLGHGAEPWIRGIGMELLTYKSATPNITTGWHSSYLCFSLCWEQEIAGGLRYHFW